MSDSGAGGDGGAKPKRQPNKNPKADSIQSHAKTKAEVTLSTTDHPLVIIDLETTGLARTDKITQLAAITLLPSGEKREFDVFVLPQQHIPPNIVKLTGISGDHERGKMFYLGKEVPCVTMERAIQKFVEWLRVNFGSQTVFLGAHNCQRFDSRFLIRALNCCNENIRKMFEKTVAGFVDTLSIFKQIYPGLRCYKQTDLVQRFLGETYKAHNAIDDVTALLKLVEFSKVAPSVVQNHSFTVESVRNKEAEAVARAKAKEEKEARQRVQELGDTDDDLAKLMGTVDLGK